jgi:hypothetical protein
VLTFVYIVTHISAGVDLKDLISFWTGVDVLPTDNRRLVVKFATDERPMPFSRTCFNTITLPTVYSDYAQFKENMDTALKYGYKGFSDL